MSLASSRTMAVSAGQAGAVTRLRSTTASVTGTGTYSPPASRADGGVGRGLVALEHAGRGQHLRAVADRRDGLSEREELTHDLEHARIEADVLRGAAAGDEQTLVILDLDGVEVGRQREVVAAQLGVGLLAEEVVHRGGDGLARLLVGADRVDLVAQDAQRLEGYHGFVILGEIAAEKKYFLCHVCFLL